jgi:hypothetical protein
MCAQEEFVDFLLCEPWVSRLKLQGQMKEFRQLFNLLDTEGTTLYIARCVQCAAGSVSCVLLLMRCWLQRKERSVLLSCLLGCGGWAASRQRKKSMQLWQR